MNINAIQSVEILFFLSLLSLEIQTVKNTKKITIPQRRDGG